MFLEECEVLPAVSGKVEPGDEGGEGGRELESQHEVSRRQQVDAAQRRFAEDDYGACLECGEAVGYARLKVQPEAPLCVACQTRREARRGRG